MDQTCLAHTWVSNVNSHKTASLANFVKLASSRGKTKKLRNFGDENFLPSNLLFASNQIVKRGMSRM